jgi:hypothetical protein
MAKKKITANKLETKHKFEVIQMLAAFEKPKTIVEHLKATHGIVVTERNVYYYLENRSEDIEIERERLRADLLSIPIANGFIRLRIRQKLIEDLVENLWFKVPVTRNGTAIAGADGIPKVMKLRGNHGLINSILDSIFRELDGQPPPPPGESLADRMGRLITDEQVLEYLAYGEKQLEQKKKRESRQ